MLPGTMPHRFPVFASASPHTGSLPGRRRPRPVAIAWHRGDPPFHEQHPSPTRPIRQGPRRLAAPGRRLPDLPAQFRRRQRGRPRRPSGLTLRMDNLAELGIDAIRLSPFYPSALADGGYDVDDHRNVDARLGTLEDFDAMVAAAHARKTSRSSSMWCPTTAPTAMSGSPRRGQRHRARPNAPATTSSTGAESTGNCRPRTGLRTSAVRPGPASPKPPGQTPERRASGTCTSSPPNNRT